MKAYGIKRKDHPKDCTSAGKFGNRKILGMCSCGLKNGKKSKKYSSAHRERNLKF